MSHTNLFAYTGGGNYPPYVSINQEGDVVGITVREPSAGRACGYTVKVELSVAQFKSLLATCIENLRGVGP